MENDTLDIEIALKTAEMELLRLQHQKQLSKNNANSSESITPLATSVTPLTTSVTPLATSVPSINGSKRALQSESDANTPKQQKNTLLSYMTPSTTSTPQFFVKRVEHSEWVMKEMEASSQKSRSIGKEKDTTETQKCKAAPDRLICTFSRFQNITSAVSKEGFARFIFQYIKNL